MMNINQRPFFAAITLAILSGSVVLLSPVANSNTARTGQAQVGELDAAATAPNTTVIYKDANGQWPGGRVWIGKTVTITNVDGQESQVEEILLVDPSLGIGV